MYFECCKKVTTRNHLYNSIFLFLQISSRHITNLSNLLFFRYLWLPYINSFLYSVKIGCLVINFFAISAQNVLAMGRCKFLLLFQPVRVTNGEDEINSKFEFVVDNIGQVKHAFFVINKLERFSSSSFLKLVQCL